MRLLDNDPANPCIGCGPASPTGLKLPFAWDGQGATAPFTVAPEHVGWPGSCHTGVLYIALVETVNWTLWGKLKQAGLPRSTSALETHRRVPVGETLTLQGRIIDPDALTVRAQALDDEDEVVAGLERTYELVTGEEACQRPGCDPLPAVPSISRLDGSRRSTPWQGGGPGQGSVHPAGLPLSGPVVGRS